MKRSQLMVGLGFVVAAMAGACALQRRMRKPGATDIVRAHYAALQAKDWEELEDLTATEVEYCDPDVEVRGREAMVARAKELEAAFSGASIEAEIVSGNGREAVAEWTYSGSHSSPLRLVDGTTLAPTGKKVSVKGISVFQVKAGRVIAEHTYWDNEALHGQLRVTEDLLPTEA